MATTVKSLLAQEDWKAERKAMRAILLDCGLEEAVKWNKLTYTHDGDNVAILYGMSDSCAIGFFKGALLEDKYDDLVTPGKHSKAMRRLHFTSVEEIEKAEKTIRAVAKDAIRLEDEGREIESGGNKMPDRPDELEEAFADDSDFEEAFEALTPGRQRGYLIHFTDAKQSETRVRRIAKWKVAIMDGKGIHDR